VKRVVGGQTWFYFYDAEGNPLWGYVPGVGYEIFNFFFQGRHLATNNVTNGLLFRHLDHLGSPRLLTTSEGGVFYRMLFHPYGEEAMSCAAAGDRRRFTGKERDAETGLDYFGARYYSGAQGRFTSPDPLLSCANVRNPQTWNRYAHGLNNPLRFSDPLGLFVWDSSLGGNASDEELRKTLAKKEANRIINRRKDIRGALKAAGKIKDAPVQAVVNAYGKEGDANGVAIASGSLNKRTAAQVSRAIPEILVDDQATKATANVLVTFDPRISGDQLTVAYAHEGQHVIDRQRFVATTLGDPNAFDGPPNVTKYRRNLVLMESR